MAKAGVGIACQNLTRQDVEEELTKTYSQRVLTGNTYPSAPTVKSGEEKNPANSNPGLSE